MFITMLGDVTAFLGLVFGYFFFWTVHEVFPRQTPPVPCRSGRLRRQRFSPAHGSRPRARVASMRSARWGARASLVGAALATIAGSAALLAGPWLSGMDPTAHSYPAIVWVLCLWTLAHAGAGLLMQGFCLVASLAGRLTPRYDADLWNASLYWHFMAFTAFITCLVIGGFPLVA